MKEITKQCFSVLQLVATSIFTTGFRQYCNNLLVHMGDFLDASNRWLLNGDVVSAAAKAVKQRWPRGLGDLAGLGEALGFRRLAAASTQAWFAFWDLVGPPRTYDHSNMIAKKTKANGQELWGASEEEQLGYADRAKFPEQSSLTKAWQYLTLMASPMQTVINPFVQANYGAALVVFFSHFKWTIIGVGFVADKLKAFVPEAILKASWSAVLSYYPVAVFQLWNHCYSKASATMKDKREASAWQSC